MGKRLLLEYAKSLMAAGYNKQIEPKLNKFLGRKLGTSKNEYKLISDYFDIRKKQIKKKESFGIVYAITRFCNLRCSHCGVNARQINPKSKLPLFETNKNEVFHIIDNIAEYIKVTKYRPFLMFGGGEPILRPDFPEIIGYSAKKLGKQNIGFCTNGTSLKPEEILRMQNNVGLIEISLDGLKEYHNNWRNPNNNLGDPFQTTMKLIDKLLENPKVVDKVEVSSTATVDNIEELPSLAMYLHSKGLENYSVHRTMPVGRMARKVHKIPSVNDYYKLFLALIEIVIKQPNFSIHIHHSLESIYSTLFIGKDIHYQPELPMGSGRHSIGIDWDGNVFFDAWSLVPPFSFLKIGNILHDKRELIDLINSSDGIMSLAKYLKRFDVRCLQCRMPCTGGMRFNAIAHHLALSTRNQTKITESHLLAGFSQIDPACPLYLNI